MKILAFIFAALISMTSIAGQGYFTFYNYNLDIEERIYDVDGLTWQETEQYVPKMEEARALFNYYQEENSLTPIEALSEVLFVIISSESKKTTVDEKLGEGLKSLDELI